MHSVRYLLGCSCWLRIPFRTTSLFVVVILCSQNLSSSAQTLQKGADSEAIENRLLRFDYIGFRPAAYETHQVDEPENERPNQAGLITVYYTNISDQPARLAYWRANGKDESHWRLGGFLAWDRNSGETLAPGQTGWLEINAVTSEFAEGEPFQFEWVGRDEWVPIGSVKGSLAEDPVQVSYLRVKPGLTDIEVHLRYNGEEPIEFIDVSVDGNRLTNLAWRGKHLDEAGHAIARATLAARLPRGESFLTKVMVKEGDEERIVCAHRRAFVDTFPIGTWGAEPERYAELRRNHIDTCVKSGGPEDDFFGHDSKKFGFRAMVSGHSHSLERLRSLGDHPAVACVMLADEPDWGVQPSVMLHADRLSRDFNRRQPTMITLCRNVKFFEYASIPDIPCQDHYCVSAPSSSQWPEPYGTRLEETGYYTRDLKRASEPKAVWVWSQGLHDWSGRPEQMVPTPDELAVQLLQNLGYGAKGNLWFTFRESVGEKYPDTKQAIQRWGRVLRLIREDLLSTEPMTLHHEAPAELQVLPLVGWDRGFIVVTNSDYELRREGYRWSPVESATLSLRLPQWLEPKAVLGLGPHGVQPLHFSCVGQQLKLELGRVHAYRLIAVLNDPAEVEAYQRQYQAIVKDESREF